MSIRDTTTNVRLPAFTPSPSSNSFVLENVANLLHGSDARVSEHAPLQPPTNPPAELTAAVHDAFIALSNSRKSSMDDDDDTNNNTTNNEQDEYIVVAKEFVRVLSSVFTRENNPNEETYMKKKEGIRLLVYGEFERMQMFHQLRSNVDSAVRISRLRFYLDDNLDFFAELLRSNQTAETFFEFAAKCRYAANHGLNRLPQPILHRPLKRSAVDQALDNVRMIDSGYWVDASGMLSRQTVQVSPAKLLYDSQFVHLVVGSSGCGKTSCAILALGQQSVVVYIIIPKKNTQFSSTKKSDCQRVANDGSQSKYSAACRTLFSLVAQVVIGRPLPNVDEMSDKEIERFSFGTNWIKLRNDHPIHVIVDEAGGHPELCNELCATWRSACREWLSNEKRFNCSLDNLYLSLVGTGLEYVERAVGSQPDSYKIFEVDPSRLMYNILQNIAKKNETDPQGRTPKIPYQPTKLAKVTQLLLDLLFANDKTRDGVPNPQDLVEHRFLQLVTTNARCAALAIDEFRLLVADLKSFRSIDATFVLRHLPEMCENIVNRFAKLNGLRKYSQDVLVLSHAEREELLARAHTEGGNGDDTEAMADAWRSQMLAGALRCAIMRPTHVSKEFWTAHAVNLGLMTDSARWYSNEYFAKHERELCAVIPTTSTPHKNTSRDIFAFRNDAPRIQVPEAVAAMYLLQFGRTGIPATRGEFRVAGGWKLFESSVADFIELCCLLKITPPTSDILKYYESTSSMDNATMTFTYPVAILSPPVLPENMVLSTVFRVVQLPYPFSEETVVQPWYQQQKERWRSIIFTGSEVDPDTATSTPQTVSPIQQFRQKLRQQQKQQQCAALIFENIGNTSFADVIAIFPGRILLIQALTEPKAEDAFDTHETQEKVLEFLIGCCQIESTPVEIISVLAGAHDDSFNKTVGLLLSKSSLPASLKGKATIQRHATVGFNRPNDLTHQTSNLYPILQFHPIDRSHCSGAAAPSITDVSIVHRVEQNVASFEDVAINTSSEDKKSQ